MWGRKLIIGLVVSLVLGAGAFAASNEGDSVERWQRIVSRTAGHGNPQKKGILFVTLSCEEWEKLCQDAEALSTKEKRWKEQGWEIRRDQPIRGTPKRNCSTGAIEGVFVYQQRPMSRTERWENWVRDLKDFLRGEKP